MLSELLLSISALQRSPPLSSENLISPIPRTAPRGIDLSTDLTDLSETWGSDFRQKGDQPPKFPFWREGWLGKRVARRIADNEHKTFWESCRRSYQIKASYQLHLLETESNTAGPIPHLQFSFSLP